MAKEIILSGVVQGVFCRKYCKDNARRMKVSGSATNLKNGSVRVILNTNDMELVNRYVQALQMNPFGYQFYGRIDSINIFNYEGTSNGDYLF